MLPTSSSATDGRPRPMSFPRLLRMFLVALVAGAVTYLLASLIPRTYSSYLTLYFPMGSSGGSSGLSLLGGSSVDSGSVPNFGGALVAPLVGAGPNTALGLVSSRTCRLDVAKRLGLDKHWGTTLSNAAGQLESMIVPSVDKSGFLQVRVNGESPVFCRRVADAVYAHLGRRSSELTLNVSAKNRRFVEERRNLALKRVADLRGQLVSIMQSNRDSDPEQVVKQYERFRQDLADARVRLAASEARFASLSQDYKGALGEVRTNSSSIVLMGSLNAKLTQLTDELQGRRLRLEDARRRFSNSAPEVRRAREELESAEKVAKSVFSGSSSSGTTAGMSPELMAAKGEVAAMRQSVDESEQSLKNYERTAARSPEQYARVRMAKEEFEQALTQVGTLSKELETARIAESRDPSRFEVIDQPFEDPIPISPKKSLFAAVVIVLALLVQLLPAIRTSLAENPA